MVSIMFLKFSSLKLLERSMFRIGETLPILNFTKLRTLDLNPKDSSAESNSALTTNSKPKMLGGVSKLSCLTKFGGFTIEMRLETSPHQKLLEIITTK
jgi:hypothetical protein